MNSDVKAIADELVDAVLAAQPLEAVLLGLPAGERALSDLSEASRSRYAASLRSIADRAEDMAQHDEPRDELDTLTLDLVRLTAASFSARLDVPLLQFTVTDLYVAPFAEILAVMPLPALDTAERCREHLARLSALPEYLTQAAEQHRAGVHSGCTPVARGVRSATAQIDAVLDDPDFRGLRRLADDDALASEETCLLADAVAPAIRAYREVLESEILPLGRGDDQPGVCWLPGGDAMYHAAIGYSTWTDKSADDLHALGLSIIEDLAGQFADVGSRLWHTTDVAEIHDRLRHDPQLRFSSSEEILSEAVQAVRRAEAEAPGWFGVVPKTPCAVEAIPEAMAAGSPTAYYFAGALDGSRAGTYFVNTTKPGERFRHLAEDIAYHEAVPGHHFQLTIAQELGGHLAHQLFGDVTTAEGWGLYAERLADEMGLYTSDLARLGLLSADAWRAARLVVDTGLHAKCWSRTRAIEWMSQHVPLSEIEVVTEVDRYISYPGQALAYMVGRMEIERLRRLASDTLGARFSVRDFHDLVLRSGPVPPPALAAAVGRWLERATN